MHVKSVALQNFLGVKQWKVEGLPPSLFITGLNRTGKTRLLQAVRFVLAGRVFDAFNNRITNGDLIGPHAKSASVVITIQTDKLFEGGNVIVTMSARIKPKGVQVDLVREYDNGATMPVFGSESADEIRTKFWKAHGTTSTRAEIALNPIPFLFGKLDLDAALSSITNISTDQLAEYAGEDYAGRMAGLFGELVSGAPVTALQIKQMGKRFDEARADMNRLKKTTAAGKPEPKNAKNEPVPVAHTGKVEAQVDALQAKRDRLAGLIENMGDVAPDEMAAGRVEEAEAIVAEANAELDETRELERSIRDSQPTPRGEEGPKCKRIRKEQESLNAKASALDVEIETLQVESARLVKLFESAVQLVEAKDIEIEEAWKPIANLQAGKCPCGGTCPKCDGLLSGAKPDLEPLKKAKAKLESARAKLVKAQERAEVPVQEATEQIQSLVEEKGGHEARYSELRDQFIEVQTKERNNIADAHKDWNAKLEDVEVRLRATREDVRKREADLAKLQSITAVCELCGDVPPASKLEELDGHLERGRTLLVELGQLAEYESKMDELSSAEDTEEFLQWGVEAFRNGEFANSLLKDTKGAFLDVCNGALEGFGIEVDLRVADGVTIMQREIGAEHWVPLAYLSKAERTIVGASIAAAFAAENNLLVLADDLDVCDGPWRAAFLSLLKEMETPMWCVASSTMMKKPDDLDALTAFLDGAGLLWFLKNSIFQSAATLSEGEANDND